MLIDCSAKNCKGAVAELEKAMGGIGAGTTVDVIVYGVPNKIDIYAWAKRKGHLVESEEKNDGALYKLVVKKG